jgi:hypothetical protein
MVHALSIWLLLAGFFGAGLSNAISTPRRKVISLGGLPALVAGGLEMISAVLIALPVSRIVGLVLGAAIIVAAVLTVLPTAILGTLCHLVSLSP